MKIVTKIAIPALLALTIAFEPTYSNAAPPASPPQITSPSGATPIAGIPQLSLGEACLVAAIVITVGAIIIVKLVRLCRKLFPPNTNAPPSNSVTQLPPLAFLSKATPMTTNSPDPVLTMPNLTNIVVDPGATNYPLPNISTIPNAVFTTTDSFTLQSDGSFAVTLLKNTANGGLESEWAMQGQVTGDQATVTFYDPSGNQIRQDTVSVGTVGGFNLPAYVPQSAFASVSPGSPGFLIDLTQDPPFQETVDPAVPQRYFFLMGR